MKSFLKWLDNYWYHYKWHTLIVLFVVVVAVVCITQMFTKTEYDVQVLYGGPCEITPNEAHEVALALQLVMPADYNGDGEKNADVLHYMLMTDSQRKEYLAQAEEKGEPVVINGKNLQQNQEKFVTQLAAGDSVICFLDPVWYQTATEKNGFVPLSSVLGETPEGAYDAYTVRLHDLPAAQYFDAFDVFPEDTLVAIRTQTVVNSFLSSDRREEAYRNQLDMFRALYRFTPVEE